jgi:hypothetical protein
MWRIKKEKLKERKEMNLKVVRNLALLCKLCASEEEFTIVGNKKYKFDNGILNIYADKFESWLPVYFSFNDLVNKADIKELEQYD